MKRWLVTVRWSKGAPDFEAKMRPFSCHREPALSIHYDTYMRPFWEHHETKWEHLVGLRKWLDKLKKRLS